MVGSVQEQIIQAVIAHNLAQLVKLVEDHPNVDLDNISPNGCSILWWALAGVTPVNIAMIDAILNLKKTNELGVRIPRVNPLQTFMKITALGFARTMVVCDKDASITLVQTIKDHMKMYEELKSSLAAVAQPVELIELLGTENTHNEHIEAEVINSIIRLYRRYWLPKRPDTKILTATIKEILSFIEQESGVGLDDTVSSLTREQKDSAIAAIKHITSFSPFQYKISEAESIDISVLRTLFLVWQASLETSKYLVQDNGTSSDIRARRIQIIKHLAQFQNERGPNSPACANGARAQILAALVGVHNDVHLFSTGKLDKIAVEYKLNAITKDFIEQYAIQIFVLYKQWLTESLCSSIESSEGLDNFKTKYKKSIVELLYDNLQYQHRTKEEKELIDQVLNESFEYGPSIAIHRFAKILRQVISFGGSVDEDAFKEKIAEIKNISELSLVCDELLSAKINDLINRIGMRSVYSKLGLKDSDKLKLIHKIKQLIIKSSSDNFSLGSLLLPDNSNDELMLETKYALNSVFYDVAIGDNFVAKKNKKWFDSLSVQQREQLLQQVLAQQTHTVITTRNFEHELILKAIKLGYTRYLDLTGFDFAGVDCRGLSFEGCDLSDADFTRAENIRLVSFDRDTIFKNTKFPEGIEDFSDVCFANHKPEDLKKFVKLIFGTQEFPYSYNTLGYAIINNPHIIPAFFRMINRWPQQERIAILSTICAHNLQIILNVQGDNNQDMVLDNDPTNWVRLSYNSLMLAVRYQPSVVNDILAAGKSIPLINNSIIHTAITHNGENSLLLAVRYNPALVAALLEAIKELPINTQFRILSQQNNNKMNPLMLALKLGDRNSANLIADFINDKKFTRKQRAVILKQADLSGDNFLTLAAKWDRAILDDMLKLLKGLKEADIRKCLLNEPGKNFLKTLYAINPEVAGDVSYFLIKTVNDACSTVVNEIVTNKFKLSDTSLKLMNYELLGNTLIYFISIVLLTLAIYVLLLYVAVMSSTVFFSSLSVFLKPLVVAIVSIALSILLIFECATAFLMVSNAYSLCRLYNHQRQLAKNDKPTEDLLAVGVAPEPDQLITPLPVLA